MNGIRGGFKRNNLQLQQILRRAEIAGDLMFGSIKLHASSFGRVGRDLKTSSYSVLPSDYT